MAIENIFRHFMKKQTRYNEWALFDNPEFDYVTS